MPHWYLWRRLRNWVRYGAWTPCRHTHWVLKEVRYALRHDQATPSRPHEWWTVCVACSVVRARRKAEGV